MITYNVFKTCLLDFSEEICLFDVFVAIFFSILVIPIDLALLPLELISLVVYKIIKTKNKKINSNILK